MVPHGLFHVAVNPGPSRGSGAYMSQNITYLLENAFWFSFGGCFLALFAYDAFTALLDYAVLLFTFLGQRFYNKSGGHND